MNNFKLFVFSFLLFISTNSYSQVFVGVTMGIDMAKVKEKLILDEPFGDYSERSIELSDGFSGKSIFIGLNGSAQIADKWDLDINIRFSRKKISADFFSTGQIIFIKIGDEHIKYDQLQAGVVINRMLGDKFRIGAGPYVSYLSNMTNHYDYNVRFEDYANNKTIYSLKTYLGYQINQFEIGLDYQKSLRISDESSFFNRYDNLSLSVTYYFEIFGK